MDLVGLGEALGRWCARRPWATVILAALVVSAPLLIAVADLGASSWYPVLDLAMTEFRVRDVFGAHPPLIGLPGRIGEYPDQGSHPGPLSFYLLAPLYRLLGSTSWALEAATVAIHLTAIAAALWIGQRRAGWRGVLGVAALLAVAIRGYGQVLLTQPWNPYLPLLAWIVVLLATWSALCGDSLMLVPLVVAGSWCAQTHVPYLVPCAVLTIGSLAYATWARGHGRFLGRRRWLDRNVVAAVAIGIVLWVPPLVDQLTNEPGNIATLLDHFGDPSEPVLGVSQGIRLALRHFDAWAGFAGFTGDLEGAGRFVSSASAWRGALMIGVWLASAIATWRHGPAALRRLHVVIGTAFVLGVLSMTRIFGLPWYYLTLWAWGTTTLALGAVAWTALAWGRRRDPLGTPAVALPIVSAVVLAVTTVVSALTFASAEVPEERLSSALGAVAGPTYDAIADGVGPAIGTDGSYQVRWSDAADIGSPGYGLLNELERRGLDVAADEFFAVPATDHRVRTRDQSDAQVHLATGGYVQRWRQVPGAVEVATYEPRTAAEIARAAELRAGLLARLGVEGLDEVAELVDTNLFGASLDPRISADDLADLTELLDLGQPMAVFIAPSGAGV
ncbi:MAG: hypothetical protein K0S92_39 [Desertimonas sp.]|nr:hypothetical protein [Desertimonas sp.]